jgi:hypothetical protein
VEHGRKSHNWKMMTLIERSTHGQGWNQSKVEVVNPIQRHFFWICGNQVFPTNLDNPKCQTNPLANSLIHINVQVVNLRLALLAYIVSPACCVDCLPSNCFLLKCLTCFCRSFHMVLKIFRGLLTMLV